MKKKERNLEGSGGGKAEKQREQEWIAVYS